MTDFSPLCVLLRPRSRMRIIPHGKSTSSINTIISAGSHSYRSSRSAPPRRSDSSSSAAWPESLLRPPASRGRLGLRFRACDANPRSLRQRIHRQKPRLCGVQAYSGPGLPRPTIIRMNDSHVSATLRCAAIARIHLLPSSRPFPPSGAAASASPSPSSSFLPFLMTSGSAGAVSAATAASGRRFFFLLQRDDVREHALRVGEQLHFLRVERQIGGAKLLADHQSR